MLCFQNFEIYHINEEISHSKCQFSHPGGCTHITYLLFLSSKRCADNRMRVHLAESEKNAKNFNITNFEILQICSEYPLKVYIYTSKCNFSSVCHFNSNTFVSTPCP